MRSNLSSDIDDLVVLVNLLARDQVQIDDALKGVSGNWYYDCNCDCECDNPRLGLLLIARWILEKAIGDSKMSEPRRLKMKYLWSLTFLMVESGAYKHFDNYSDQAEHEEVYALNWLLLSELAQQLKIERVPPNTLADEEVKWLFEKQATRC